MSLNIYRRREDVPEGMEIIDCNDSFFGLYSVDDCDFTRMVIEKK